MHHSAHFQYGSISLLVCGAPLPKTEIWLPRMLHTPGKPVWQLVSPLLSCTKCQSVCLNNGAFSKVLPICHSKAASPLKHALWANTCVASCNREVTLPSRADPLLYPFLGVVSTSLQAGRKRSRLQNPVCNQYGHTGLKTTKWLLC